MKKLFILSMTLISLSLYAHEGHDHGPGQVQPVKGGVIMKSDDLYLEVVGTKSEIKLYPFTQQEGKSLLTGLPLDSLKIKATYKLPRGKETKEITLQKNKDHFSGNVEAKTHRYQVDAYLEYNGEKEHFTYQIEPQD